MLAACFAIFSNTEMSKDPTPIGATPTARQLAWHDRQTYAFVHFGPNTFTSKEWGNGKEDPEVFNPTELSTDQWCQTFKNAGLTGVILTAKHHDGFCLWPSQFSSHTIAKSPYKKGKGDLLKELSASCKKYGLWMGVYLSPWDQNHPDYGTPKYNQVFTNTLTEVLSNYGEIKEVWFDGANGEGPNGKKQVYDFELFNSTVRKLQPNAVIFSDAGPDIRWVGNESGYSDPTCWATLNRDNFVPGTPLYQQLTKGHEKGSHWVPAECDVSIRRGWFWKESENSTVKSPEQLLDLYLRSCGQNSNFLLNVPPDTRGLIHENDVKTLMGWKKLRDELYSKPIAVKTGSQLADSSLNSYQSWEHNPFTIQFKKFELVKTVILQEPIQFGQRIKKWRLISRTPLGVKTMASGTTIGYKRIVQFDPIETNNLSLVSDDSSGSPILATLKPYR